MFDTLVYKPVQRAFGLKSTDWLPKTGLVFKAMSPDMTDSIGVSTRLVQKKWHLLGDGTGYLANAAITGGETVVSNEGTAAVTIAAGRINVGVGTLWNLTLNNGSIYAAPQLTGTSTAIMEDISGNGRHLALTGFTVLSAVVESFTVGSDTLNYDGFSERENLFNAPLVSVSNGEWTRSIDASGYISHISKVEAPGSVTVSMSSLRTTAQSTTYKTRFKLLAIAGGTAQRVDFGLHNGSFSGLTASVISGPGSVVVDGYIKISGLSETIPTEIEFTKDNYTVGTSIGIFFFWPNSAASGAVGTGCKIKDLQICETTIKALGSHSTSGRQLVRSIGIPATKKVVCIGDSLSFFYPTNLATLFPTLTVVNSGVSGNTSAQMLARFTADVLAHAPDICVIQASANDRLQEDISSAVSIANLTSMVGLCVANGITPIITNQSPLSGAAGWTAQKQIDLEAVNTWIAAAGYDYLDTYVKMRTDTHLANWANNGDYVHYTEAAKDSLAVWVCGVLPVTFTGSDARGYAPENTGRVKYSLLDPPQWPSTPDIIAVTGVDNAVYDASGVGIVFDTPALALAAMASLADDTYLFGGTKGAALYSVDMSAKAVVIKNYVGD